jgi:hypothetical protein
MTLAQHRAITRDILTWIRTHAECLRWPGPLRADHRAALSVYRQLLAQHMKDCPDVPAPQRDDVFQCRCYVKPIQTDPLVFLNEATWGNFTPVTGMTGKPWDSQKYRK